ncbi:MAG: exodeoxyribonuclease VII small subunit [Spongiibacteraceae bacterium]
MAKAKTIKFETALNELEGLVHSMESGELSLEESLKNFEKGMQLSRDCQQALLQAEQKIEVLMEKDGELSVAPLATDDEI